MTRRIDWLAELRTEAVSFTGGEPLLHPSLTGLVAHVRARGMTAALITNGYLLSIARIRELDDAGLQGPATRASTTSTPTTCRRRACGCSIASSNGWRARPCSTCTSTRSSAPGHGARKTRSAIAQRARALGLSTSVGIIHDRHGQLKPLSAEERQIYEQVRAIGTHGAWLFKNLYSGLVKFEAEPGRGPPEHVAMPRGRPLPVCLRGRAGPLLLAAARDASESRSRVHALRHRARLPDAQGVRAVLHDRLRAPRVDHALPARSADGRERGPRESAAQWLTRRAWCAGSGSSSSCTLDTSRSSRGAGDTRRGVLKSELSRR